MGLFLTAATLIAPSPAIEKALVQAAPDQATLTLALNTSFIYLGQGVGTALGGLILGTSGYSALGALGSAVAAIGLLISPLLGRTGRRNGVRRS